MRTCRTLMDHDLAMLLTVTLALACHSRIVEAMTAVPPSESDPQPVVAWPGWVWWRDGRDGHPRARNDGTGQRAGAHNFTVLLARIRRAEGGSHGGDGR